MSVLSWNCRGLGNLRTVKALKRAMQQQDPICVFLMETKLTTEQLYDMKQEWVYNQGLIVSSTGLSGGLALLWKPGTQVHVQNFSRWFIDAHIICDDTGTKWRLTGFYGHPETCKREETWTLLESLRHSTDLPWLCIGDYNEIVSRMEKSGGSLRPTRQMDRFRSVIHTCGFIDLGFVGPPYTWSRNHHVEGRIHIRLDRALATTPWKTLFPNATVRHISMYTSDHSMLAVQLQPHRHLPQHRTQRPFRFEAMWLRDPRCVKVI